MTSTDPTVEPIVRLIDASKRYHRGAETIVAVREVTITLVPGTLTVVSGPSGSGKTTLLNLLLGWEEPDEGRRDPATPIANWAETAVVPQRLGLLDHCTVAENVSLPGRAVALPFGADAVMKLLGIDHLAARFPPETSLGEQQRTAVARALVSRPRLLIADEPTSHQDEANTQRICELLVDAAAHGSCVVAATHDPRVAVYADHHVHLVDGHLEPAPALPA